MTPPRAPQDMVYAELRAVGPVPNANQAFPLWYIEGRADPNANPDDNESWSWVADVDGTDHFFEREPGDLTRFLALSANAHGSLVEALEGCIALIAAAFPTTGAAITAEARAALALARREPAAVQGRGEP